VKTRAAKGALIVSRTVSRATSLVITRRRILQAAGGLAASAAVGPVAGFGRRTASAQDAVSVTMWGNHPEWKDPMEELIQAFQAAVPGVEIDFSAVTSDQYGAKIQTAIAGGQTSDIFGDQEGSIIVRAREGGELPFIDLTGKVDISGLTDTARGQVEVDGKVYGCPLAAYTVGVAINNPVFAKAEVPPPTTWDELTAACEALKAAGVEAPVVLGGKDWVHPYFMYIGLSSSVLGPEGFAEVQKGTRKLTDPDVVAAVQLLLDLVPYYNKGFEATDYTTAKAIFANGRGAMMVAGTADYTGYKQVNPEADLSFIAWPGPEAGKRATTTGFELLYTASSFSPPEKQEAAAKFVNWLATEEAQQIVMDKISLSVNKNVTKSADPIREQTVAESAGVDVPVWYDVPELNGSVIATQDNHGGLWTGRITPEQFSQIQQDAVVPSGS
jgi:raffinose/stachyose/melibiose transport system substrate-binding protein